MANLIREAALFYRRRGWSVIPTAPASKRPLIEWAEFQERLPSEKEINRWWRKFPHAGVGIVTGKISGIVVLDVDPKHGADANDVFRRFPTPLVAQTGGGGGHFFFAYPKDVEYIPNVVGRKDGQPTGYDLRADGGYVCASPTLHPSGHRYRWIQTGKTPAPIPTTLLHDILPKADLNGKAGLTEPWLADALRGVGEGARDDTCARLAGYMLSKGEPVDVVRQQLLNWNERNTPPLSDADIDKTLDSIQRTRARRPNTATHAHTSAPDLDDQPQDLLRLISLHQYMSTYGQIDIKWAVDEWLPDATIGMMVSPPGTYKTWVLIDLAVSIATATPFLGTATVRQSGPVLIYQQEDFHGQMAQRIGTIMAARFHMGWDGDLNPKTFALTLPPSPPIYLHDNRELRFDDPDVMDVLEARIAELRPVLVIVDPLYTTVSLDDYMAKAVSHMMRLKRLRDLYGCSFMLAHHTGKHKEQSKSNREDAWGSQFLNAFLETGWQIRPKREGTALIRRHFKVSKDIPEMTLSFKIQTDMPSQYITTLAEIVPDLDTDIGIIAALDKHGHLSREQLADELGVSSQTIWRQIKPMVEAGAVLRQGKSYYTPDHFDV